MFPKLFFYFSSYLTPNGLETLAKPCLLFKINVKIKKIHNKLSRWQRSSPVRGDHCVGD
jgi:hypothetical protein